MPLACGCPRARLSYSEVTRVICLVPSTSFSQAPWYTLPVHLCRFRVRSLLVVLFPGPSSPLLQSDKEQRFTTGVTSTWPTNINVVPIDYAFRPRLRGRLTLRGLALRRNPWTYGDRVSHPVCRYSCQHSHFRYLQQTSQFAFAGLRNAPLPLVIDKPAASVHGFSPGTSSAQDSLIRPVSCYAFFKGWLLLSQPPGCFGRPTSFPT